MNVFKIAIRSIQHRGLGSLLTIISMALGVMLVVAVLSIHGVVSKQFKNNSSFGYNVLVGARGGGLQLTMNTVYYLSRPVENIPYEYYLAFCDQPTRMAEMQNSIAVHTQTLELQTLELCGSVLPGCGAVGATLINDATYGIILSHNQNQTGINKNGLYRPYTHIAIPMCLGDYWEAGPAANLQFRCVGTKPSFFQQLVLDADTGEQFEFAEGRCFDDYHPENGYFECVVGAVAARRSGVKIGDKINPTHGDPNAASAHLHERGFTVVGILQRTGTPHDRVVFLNMEGFYLMEDHAKNVEDDSVLSTGDESATDLSEFDPFAEDDSDSDEGPVTDEAASNPPPPTPAAELTAADRLSSDKLPAADQPFPLDDDRGGDRRQPLPIEQREVTSILVRTHLDDPFGVYAYYLPPKINEGDLESTLAWSNFRPIRAQKAAQAVNPINEVESLFRTIVDPVRWLLLALTCMICIVSGIGILVGIYNSMNQRQHEIAVMRALGASRTKVMLIMLCEAILLAISGGLLGWLMGHGLNVVASEIIENQTGVSIGFFDFAPGIPLLGYLGGDSIFPERLLQLQVSPEFLLIPGLILLAIVVGIYPAISAYRTDVAKSLGK